MLFSLKLLYCFMKTVQTSSPMLTAYLLTVIVKLRISSKDNTEMQK